jgi:hypothetical protein
LTTWLRFATLLVCVERRDWLRHVSGFWVRSSGFRVLGFRRGFHKSMNRSNNGPAQNIFFVYVRLPLLTPGHCGEASRGSTGEHVMNAGEMGTFSSRFSAVSVLCRSIVGPISFLFDTPSLKKYSFTSVARLDLMDLPQSYDIQSDLNKKA